MHFTRFAAGSGNEVSAGYPASSSKVDAPGIPWQQIAFHTDLLLCTDTV